MSLSAKYTEVWPQLQATGRATKRGQEGTEGKGMGTRMRGSVEGIETRKGTERGERLDAERGEGRRNDKEGKEGEKVNEEGG